MTRVDWFALGVFGLGAIAYFRAAWMTRSIFWQLVGMVAMLFSVVAWLAQQ